MSLSFDLNCDCFSLNNVWLLNGTPMPRSLLRITMRFVNIVLSLNFVVCYTTVTGDDIFSDFRPFSYDVY